MVSVLASDAVDRGFEPWSGQTKDFKIGICCFWLTRNQNNISEWSGRGLYVGSGGLPFCNVFPLLIVNRYVGFHFNAYHSLY